MDFFIRTYSYGLIPAELGIRSYSCGVIPAELGIRSYSCGVMHTDLGMRSYYGTPSMADKVLQGTLSAKCWRIKTLNLKIIVSDGATGKIGTG